MNKEKNFTKDILYIILAILAPIVTWLIFQIALNPREWDINIWGIGYQFGFWILFPLSILIGIALLITGISYLVPNINIPALRKSKKEMVARKCKACGFEVPAGENICPNCMVLNLV